MISSFPNTAIDCAWSAQEFDPSENLDRTSVKKSLTIEQENGGNCAAVLANLVAGTRALGVDSLTLTADTSMIRR